MKELIVLIALHTITIIYANYGLAQIYH